MKTIMIGENDVQRRNGAHNGAENIVYATDSLLNAYISQRRSWDSLYPSERWVIERIASPDGHLGRVLDVGCAVGGLGQALAEQFILSEYVGIDINSQCIGSAEASVLPETVKRRFICTDILDWENLGTEEFQFVFSLSCADWNIRTSDMIKACWASVSPGGYFVLTLRLTSKRSVSSFEDSFQYVYFGEDDPEEKQDIEKAPYVVFNVFDALALISHLDAKPEKILAYGYWGCPSATARTPYSHLVFTALAVKKGCQPVDETKVEFHLPLDLFCNGNSGG